jgi:hypothetical protein
MLLFVCILPLHVSFFFLCMYVFFFFYRRWVKASNKNAYIMMCVRVSFRQYKKKGEWGRKKKRKHRTRICCSCKQWAIDKKHTHICWITITDSCSSDVNLDFFLLFYRWAFFFLWLLIIFNSIYLCFNLISFSDRLVEIFWHKWIYKVNVLSSYLRASHRYINIYI